MILILNNCKFKNSKINLLDQKHSDFLIIITIFKMLIKLVIIKLKNRKLKNNIFKIKYLTSYRNKIYKLTIELNKMKNQMILVIMTIKTPKSL